MLLQLLSAYLALFSVLQDAVVVTVLAHFGISEGKGGLKHGSRPWLGMDIFWNCPINLWQNHCTKVAHL